MKAKDYIYLSIITLTVIMILSFNHSCNREGNYNGDSDTTTTIVTEYITIRDTIIKSVPKPYKVIQFDTIYQLDSVECQELAERYYSELLYNDTLLHDSTLFFAISETISRNRIIHRSVNYKQSKQIETVTNNITKTIYPKQNPLNLKNSKNQFQTSLPKLTPRVPPSSIKTKNPKIHWASNLTKITTVTLETPKATPKTIMAIHFRTNQCANKAIPSFPMQMASRWTERTNWRKS
jgi:hypothetical protein